MPAEKINIEVTDQGAIFRILYPDGRTEIRTTTCQGFLDVFRIEDITTPQLPPNTYLYSKGGGKEKIIYIVPPQKTTLYWKFPDDGRKFNGHLTLPMPRLLYFIELADKRLNKKLVFALKSYPKGLDEVLHLFPYGNAYEDGKICWGNHVCQKIDSIEDVIFMHIDLMSSVFNTHILVNGLTFNDVETLNNKPDFPTKFWHALNNGRTNGMLTIKDIWERKL